MIRNRPFVAYHLQIQHVVGDRHDSVPLSIAAFFEKQNLVGINGATTLVQSARFFGMLMIASNGHNYHIGGEHEALDMLVSLIHIFGLNGKQTLERACSSVSRPVERFSVNGRNKSSSRGVALSLGPDDPVSLIMLHFTHSLWSVEAK
jgi:hypothetical protein